MSENDKIEAVVAGVAAASWNARVALIRKIPEEFGKAQHQAVYAAVAKTVYVSDLAPDFAFVHWRDEYELKPIERAYEKSFALTTGFTAVDPVTLAAVMQVEPSTVRIFRLFLGFTIKELAGGQWRWSMREEGRDGLPRPARCQRGSLIQERGKRGMSILVAGGTYHSPPR